MHDSVKKHRSFSLTALSDWSLRLNATVFYEVEAKGFCVIYMNACL